MAQLWSVISRRKDYGPHEVQASINHDYFNKMLAKGAKKGDMATAKALIEATAMLRKYRVLNVNALTLNKCRCIYLSGELGYALAWGNEYMNQLTDAGLPAALQPRR